MGGFKVNQDCVSASCHVLLLCAAYCGFQDDCRSTVPVSTSMLLLLSHETVATVIPKALLFDFGITIVQPSCLLPCKVLATLILFSACHTRSLSLHLKVREQVETA
eukprot:3820-Heterococcus_DN1.PRE.2